MSLHASFAERNFSCSQESSASLPSRWLSAVSVSPPWPRPSQHRLRDLPLVKIRSWRKSTCGNQALRGARTIASLPPQVQQMPPQMIFPAVIDQIINGKLVAEAGYKNNVQNDPEVAERLKRSEERIVSGALPDP